MTDELAEQNRILRARVAELEETLTSGVDPVLRALLEHAPGFLFVINLEGRLLATGRTSAGFGSVIGRSMFEFTPPSDHAILRDALERVRATGAPVVYEAGGYGEDGEPGHSYTVRAVPLRDGDEIRSIVLVPTDITEKVRLNRSLLESEQALRLAVHASRIGLWRWDTTTSVIEWDDRMREIWGVDEAPASDEKYMELVHPDDRALVTAVVEEALETGVYRTFEHRLAGGTEGVERWILASGSRLKDADGKPTGLMGGVIDISEQKRQATRMARAERVESVGQLAAGLAHNFNNLLAVIILNLEVAARDGAVTDGAVTDAPPQKLGLAAAFDASLQARELVRSLLALTHHRPANAGAATDPKDAVRRAEAICRTTFPREITIASSIDPAVSHVSMPTSDVDQVLLNLLLNARDAVDKGSSARRIELNLDRVITAMGVPSARIQVIDSGIGMTEDVRRRIFEPFFSTKSPHQGSGLGLANAAARVREAGGELLCESTPGVGTTFTLVLAETSPPIRATAPAKPEGSVGRSKTVLLVDDEPQIRASVRRLLESTGWRVLDAASAAEAREMLDRHGDTVDLIVIDHSMPLETGMDALPSLRARCAAPVILFTGNAPAETSGVDAILEKPATANDIERVFRDVLERAR